MAQDFKHKIQKIGLSPGTLVIPEGSCPVKATLHLIRYNQTSFDVFHNLSLEDVVKNIKPDAMHWIQVEGTRDIELIQRIGKKFSLLIRVTIGSNTTLFASMKVTRIFFPKAIETCSFSRAVWAL